MNISVFGLGYVGLVTSAYFLNQNHKIFGIDCSKQKINQLLIYQKIIQEPGVNEILLKFQKKKHFLPSVDYNEALLNSDLSFVCVGTPNDQYGYVDFSSINSVIKQIASVIKIKKRFHLIVIRSTIPPGTVSEKIIPILEKYSQKKNGIDFNLFFNPEFLREGSALVDFEFPEVTVIGRSSNKGIKIINELFSTVKGKIILTDFQTAETVKYMNNIWHAFKITFANEFNLISDHFKVNKSQLLKIFLSDKKLNISSKYLLPGLPFGGSCLPKDVTSISIYSKRKKIELPLISKIIYSNDRQIKNWSKKLSYLRNYNVLCLGYAFKNNSDDCRESPILKIIYKIKFNQNKKIYMFDKNVDINHLYGANYDFLSKFKDKLDFIDNQKFRTSIKNIQKIIIFNNQHYYLKKIMKIYPNIQSKNIILVK